MIFGAGACDTGAGGYMALELDELAVVDITGTGAGDVYTGAFDIS